MPAPQETTTFLHEIVGYLAHQGKPSAMLFATVDGASEEAIAEVWQCTTFNVKKHVANCGKRLRTWAHWTDA